MSINAEKYSFNDFTINNYRELLQIAKEKEYQFCDYLSYSNFKSGKILLWRHDVDFSVHAAFKLAEIEMKEGVASTYFFNLHNEFYNLFEKEIYDLVVKIINLGHTIGLHFDPTFYNIKTESELDIHIEVEKEILQKLFNVSINVFSFHNTNPFIMSCRKAKYGGLFNTYCNDLQQNFKYVSDSNGYWRFESIKKVVLNNEYTKVQVLTHPEWWKEKVMSPKQKAWYCIEGRAEKNKTFYTNLLKKFNRELIDW